MKSSLALCGHDYCGDGLQPPQPGGGRDSRPRRSRPPVLSSYARVSTSSTGPTPASRSDPRSHRHATHPPIRLLDSTRSGLTGFDEVRRASHARTRAEIPIATFDEDLSLAEAGETPRQAPDRSMREGRSCPSLVYPSSIIHHPEARDGDRIVMPPSVCDDVFDVLHRPGSVLSIRRSWRADASGRPCSRHGGASAHAYPDAAGYQTILRNHNHAETELSLPARAPQPCTPVPPSGAQLRATGPVAGGSPLKPHAFVTVAVGARPRLGSRS